MSAGKVELVEDAYAHYAQTGDISEENLVPEFEWHTASDLPDSDVYRGVEAVRAFIQGWPSAFEEFWAEIDQIIDRGDLVVASLILHGRIRGSGEEVELPETHVWRFRDGKAVEVREYRTVEAALEAVGDVADQHP